MFELELNYYHINIRLLKVLRRVYLSMVNTIGRFSVAIVNAFQLLNIVRKIFILDIAGCLDPLLQTLCESGKSCFILFLQLV